MKKRDMLASSGLPLRKCSFCQSEVEFCFVHRYTWKISETFSVDIPDAKVIICPLCGEGPVNSEEADRWEALADIFSQAKNPKYSGIVCDICGVPKEDTGEFYYIGWEREEKICGECFSKADSRTVGSGSTHSGTVSEVS